MFHVKHFCPVPAQILATPKTRARLLLCRAARFFGPIAGTRCRLPVVTAAPPIWAVDMAGQILFAMEELVLNGEPKGIPKHQPMELTINADKLGHPALVGCAAARIGGEI
jgi:hypothetical protein